MFGRLLAILGTVTMAGCSTWSLAPSIPLLGDEKPQKPVRVVAMWSNTIVQPPGGGAAVRGFAGRLLFYAEDGKKPCRVDGTCVIYAFDEEGRNPENVKPDRKYVFTPEQFAKHYGKTELGHSYSVWIPWDEVGGPRKEVSLIVRFLPTGGGVAMSEQTRQYLAGPVNAKPAEEARPSAVSAERGRDAGVQAASYESPAGEDSPSTGEGGRPRMVTTTIPVPDEFARRPPFAPRPVRRRDSLSGPPAIAPEEWQTPRNPTASALPDARAPRWDATSPQGSTTPSAESRPTASAPPTTRSVPGRLRAPGEPVVPPARDRVPTRPRPSVWPSPRAASPQPATENGSGWSAPGVPTS
ncbi:MAG: hypothetical protein NUV77_05725 [Thermoguttaceae bacterium]|nr:hypothetical protein [Thermoguttaceae bacterium]